MSCRHDTNRDERRDYRAEYRALWEQGRRHAREMRPAVLRGYCKAVKNQGLPGLYRLDGAEGRPFCYPRPCA